MWLYILIIPGYRMYWLHLYNVIKPTPNEEPGYDAKPSDGEGPVLELWGM